MEYVIYGENKEPFGSSESSTYNNAVSSVPLRS